MKAQLSAKRFLFLGASLLSIVAPPRVIYGQMGVASHPSFEVATIKPNRSNKIIFGGINTSGNRLIIVGKTLKELIAYAYQMRDWQIKGGPRWIDSERWNIEAKAGESKPNTSSKSSDPSVPTSKQFMLMLQALLEDRFTLKIQRQTKPAPVFYLVVAKGGPKIKLSDYQGPPDKLELPLSPVRMGVRRGSVMMRPNMIEACAVSIETFIAYALRSRSDRPVIDRTNLTGLYDIKMQWSPEDFAEANTANPSSSIASVDARFDLAFFSLIQEQLGLRLESGKGPVDFIVIDGVQKPSEN